MLPAKFIAVFFRAARPRALRNALCLALAAHLLSACSDKPDQGLFEGTAAQEAIKKVGEKLKPPVRVLKIVISPENLTIQVQNPAARRLVLEYTYDDSSELAGLIFPVVSGPKTVSPSLLNPNLEENLFNLDQVNLSALPAATGEAVQRLALDGGGAVKSVTIERQVRILPDISSGDVQWEIAVRGPSESGSAFADAQGRIGHLDLSGTRRAQTVDYTQDTELLTDAITRIRNQFGAGPNYLKITVSKLSVGFKMRDPDNPNETRTFSCDLNGFQRDLLDVMQVKIPKNPFEKGLEFFSIDDADWSRLPALKKIALETIVLPNGRVFDIEVTKPGPKLKPQPLRMRVKVLAGTMGESGYADFDPKSGQLIGVELPPSQVVPVDFLDPAKTPTLFANIAEDFGAAAQFLEITISRDRATVKAPTPGHPDQIQGYDYDAKSRANPSFFPMNPMDKGFKPADLFSVNELQGFGPRVAELVKKALERLRLPDGRVDRLTLFRRDPFYPRNKKLLLEIRCEGSKGDGRVLYDLAGDEIDLVGGNPAPGSRPAGDPAVAALFKQWQGLINADAVAEEMVFATRWGRLMEKGTYNPRDITREDSREFRLAENGRIESARQCVAFLERPGTVALLPQLIETTETQNFGHRKFLDPQFWRLTIRRMTASNDFKRLTEEHWEELGRGARPVEGQPNLKPWQRQYLQARADEAAARVERAKIAAKYEEE
jgi:hypothetical protein